MLTCPTHRVVQLEKTEAGMLCFLCKAVVDPVEVEDPEHKLLGFRPRKPPPIPDDEGPREGTNDKPIRNPRLTRAIEEYKRLLREDPTYARTKQKLGELCQKRGDNVGAADYFEQVAESYAGDGFALRAVAVYKQVLKLAPERISVRLKLAELYQQLGLMSDAMRALEEVCAHYERTGSAEAMLGILQRMVSLDSDNVASRIKMAELLVRLERLPEALDAFRTAAAYLHQHGRLDDWLKVAERIQFLDPSDVDLVCRLAGSYLERNDPAGALAKLQAAAQIDPGNLAVLALIARSFEALDDKAKAADTLESLAVRHEAVGDGAAAGRARAHAAHLRRPTEPA